MYSKGEETAVVLKAFVDSDFTVDLDKRRSTSGYLFTLFGNNISLRPVLQPVVTLSTTEA